MIVVHYIKNEHRRFCVFVSNRVAIIHNAREIDQWRHVGTKENPADIVSRGMPPSGLKDDEKWFVGPAFLHQLEERWPTCPIEKEGIREDDPEVKPVIQSFATSEDKKCIDQLFMHYSTRTRVRSVLQSPFFFPWAFNDQINMCPMPLSLHFNPPTHQHPWLNFINF